jgi:hypothetical protein
MTFFTYTFAIGDTVDAAREGDPADLTRMAQWQARPSKRHFRRPSQENNRSEQA